MSDTKNEKLQNVDKELQVEKRKGLGIRHLQMVCMFTVLLALFIARSCMGVAVLAMSDVNRKSESTATVYNWDKKIQSYILSSFFWGYVVMQIPSGVLTKRFGGKPILLVSLLVNGTLCTVIPILADLGGWAFVCGARVIMGLSQACLFPATHTLLGQWYPPNERTSYAGIIFGGVQAGTIISMPVSGLLAETKMGWMLIFYTMSVLLFLTAALWYFFAASSPREHRLISLEERDYVENGLKSCGGAQKLMRTPWKEILTSKTVYGITATNFASAIAFVLFFVDMPTYLEKGMKISLKNSAALSALPYVGMWIGNTGSTILAEKLLNRNIVSLTLCRKLFNTLAVIGVTLGLIALSVLGPDNRTEAILALVLTLTMSGFYSAGFSVNGLDIAPNFAGVILGLTNGVSNIGAILTPIMTGIILGNDSSNLSRWRVVFLITAALSIVSNLIYVMLANTEKQPWNDPEYFDTKKCDPEELKSLTKDEANKSKTTTTKQQDD